MTCFLTVDAHSTELVETAKEPVVIFMPEGSRTHLGGTMRLGLRPTIFQPDTEWSTVRKLYGGETEVHERHRHRYEINPDYIQRLEDHGLRFVGRDDKGERMEIFELPTHSDQGPSHPYYVGVQYHPELKRFLSWGLNFRVNS
jgi:CTP synthase